MMILSCACSLQQLVSNRQNEGEGKGQGKGWGGGGGDLGVNMSKLAGSQFVSMATRTFDGSNCELAPTPTRVYHDTWLHSITTGRDCKV